MLPSLIELVRASGDGDAPKRLQALHTIAYRNVGSEHRWERQESLQVFLLTDASDVVRHEAAFLIGDLALNGRLFSNDTAFSALTVAAVDPSILVRHEVALALANFPTTESEKLLLTLSKDPAIEVRSSAIYAAADMMLKTVKTNQEGE